MRIVCPEYGLDFNVSECEVTELVIESSDNLLIFMERLLGQYKGEDSFWMLSQNGEELNFNKMVDIETNPFELNINNRKILSKVYQEMINDACDMNRNEIAELKMMMEKFIIDICASSEYRLEYNGNIDYIDLLKMFDVRISEENGDICECIVAYIKLMHRLINKSLFIFVNFRSVLSDFYMKTIYETLQYEQVAIIMIERVDYGFLDFEKRVIIDKDCCIINE